jgi:flagellin
MLSINNNYGASVALKNLNSSNKQLVDVQNAISTGLKVASARDNGAVFAIAEGQRSRVSSIASVKDGIDRANAAIDVALSAGEAVGKILKDMKTKAVAAQAADLSTEQRAALQTDFDSLRAQIDQVVNASIFNGINLVAAGGANLDVAMSDINAGTAGVQVASEREVGVVPGLAAYIVGSGPPVPPGNLVTINDGTTFRIGGVDIGTVTLTATMTIQQYLDSVSTQTGGRVTASYNQSIGQFVYRAAEASFVANPLSVVVKTGGTVRNWLGHSENQGPVTTGASTMSVSDWDWSAGGSGALATVSTASNLLSSAGSARATASNIDTAITALNSQLATMGSQAKALDVQGDFMSKLADVVEKGISNLVDADLAKESAKLQSLQIKQQLGAQALSIANQSPQLILSFFR